MSKILIADDNEINMKLLTDVLEASEIEVDKAFDGEEALEKINNNVYDLIILDIQMPKKSGYEVLAEVKKNIKVLIISACAMDKEIKLAKNIGCLDYITKPIKVFDVVAKIKNIINFT